jgi:hypothetical protein
VPEPLERQASLLARLLPGSELQTVCGLMCSVMRASLVRQVAVQVQLHDQLCSGLRSGLPPALRTRLFELVRSQVFRVPPQELWL